MGTENGIAINLLLKAVFKVLAATSLCWTERTTSKRR